MAGATDYLFIVLDDGDGKGENSKFVAAQLAWIKEQIAALAGAGSPTCSGAAWGPRPPAPR